ncbi:hypothetical protein Tco_0649727 [Tanacetum coccineum]
MQIWHSTYDRRRTYFRGRVNYYVTNPDANKGFYLRAKEIGNIHPLLDEPEIGFASLKDRSSSSAVPEDEPSSVVPEDEPSSPVPEDEPSSAVPADVRGVGTRFAGPVPDTTLLVADSSSFPRAILNRCCQSKKNAVRRGPEAGARDATLRRSTSQEVVVAACYIKRKQVERITCLELSPSRLE